jgi:hypothetical protein
VESKKYENLKSEFRIISDKLKHEKGIMKYEAIKEKFSLEAVMDDMSKANLTLEQSNVFTQEKSSATGH